MPLSWNEIRSRSIEFSNDFSSAEREHAEAKSFWDAFFNVFGISRRRVATFEKPVKKLNNKQGSHPVLLGMHCMLGIYISLYN